MFFLYLYNFNKINLIEFFHSIGMYCERKALAFIAEIYKRRKKFGSEKYQIIIY